MSRNIRVNNEGVSEEWFFEVLFNSDLWTIFKKYMYPGKRTSNFYDYRDSGTAIYYDYIGLIVESPYIIFTEHSVTIAAEKGYLQVLIWIDTKYNVPEEYYIKAMNIAAENGHLEIVKWISNVIKGWISDTFTYAIRNRQVKIVTFLYENIFSHPVDLNVVDYREYYSIVKFLLFHEVENCYFRIALNAITHNDTNVIASLQRREGGSRYYHYVLKRYHQIISGRHYD